jgi:hypothetical protein
MNEYVEGEIGEAQLVFHSSNCAATFTEAIGNLPR